MLLALQSLSLLPPNSRLWQPSDAVGVTVLEFDPATLTATNGAAVPSITSKTGGVTASAAGSAQPTYSATGINGQPALTFSGGQILRTPEFTQGPNWAAFSVCLPTVVSPNLYGIMDADNYSTGSGNRVAQYLRFNNGTLESIAFTPAIQVQTAGTPAGAAGVAKIAASSLPSNTVQASLNGGTLATATLPAAPKSGLAALTLGCWSSTADPPNLSYFQGMIAYWAQVQGVLSQADYDRFVGYLAWRFGLVASLPSGHTYKNVPPSVVTAATYTASITEAASAGESSTVATGPTFATWNPADKSANATLSPDNLTFTDARTGTETIGVRATIPITVKTCLEFRYGPNSVDDSYAIGIVGSAFDVSALTGPQALYWNNDGIYSGPDGTIANNLGWFQGCPIRLCIDPFAMKAWWSVNGGNWNGNASADPATGAFGYSISHITNPTVIAQSFTSGNAVTMNAGQTAFNNSVPSGFTPGLYTAAGAGNYTASITEPASASDTSTSVLSALASQTEPATAADSATNTLVATSSLTEPVSAADAPTAAFSGVNTITEAATASESAGSALSVTATRTEAATAADSASAALTMAAARSEPATAADTAATNIAALASITEAASAADSASPAASAVVSITETVTTGDSASAAFLPASSLTETASAGDSAAVLATLFASISEPVTPTDTLLLDGQTAASLTESVTAGDAMSSSAVYPAAVTEPASPGDSATNTATWIAARSEAATAGETSAATATWPATRTEAASAGDTETAIFNATATRSEPAAAGDTETATQVFAVSITEAVTATDVRASQYLGVTSRSEPVTATDAESAQVVSIVSITEAVTAGDSPALAGSNTSASITESVTAGDGFGSLTLQDSNGDPVLDQDGQPIVVGGGVVLSMAAALSESVSASDATTGDITSRSFTASITESANLGDGEATFRDSTGQPVLDQNGATILDPQAATTAVFISAPVAGTATITESASASDGIPSPLLDQNGLPVLSGGGAVLDQNGDPVLDQNGAQIVSDGQPILGAPTLADPVLQAVASITEGASPADSASTLIAALATRTEPVTAGDSAGTALASAASRTEAVSAGDSVSAVFVAAASITEAVSAGHTATTQQAGVSSLTEAVSANDFVTTGNAIVFVSVIESVNAADTQQSVLSGVASRTEPVTAGESYVATGLSQVSRTEAVSAGDSSAAGLSATASVSEAAAANDNRTAVGALAASISEAVSAGDAPAIFGSAVAASITEAVSAGDSAQQHIAAVAARLESIAAGESANDDMRFAASRIEPLSLGDSATALVKEPPPVGQHVIGATVLCGKRQGTLLEGQRPSAVIETKRCTPTVPGKFAA